MKITTYTETLHKRHPLTISRGTSSSSENLFVEVEYDGITGLGEMSPYGLGDEVQADAQGAIAAIDRWRPRLEPLAPWEMQPAEQVFHEMGGLRGAWTAIDLALYDWLGKYSKMPVYRLLGLDPARIAVTTITVGISSPELAAERAVTYVSEGAKRLKIKLGSPAGIEADQAMFEAVRAAVPPGLGLQVDANGGWSVSDAKKMLGWLAERYVEYVEQPLARGMEDALPELFHKRPLPIFADESCLVASDVPKLAGCVDGVNLKLMKAGGIREGLRLIHTVRAHSLKVMMGCMAETSLAIAGSIHLAPLADYLDLDSHLNLAPDPFDGLSYVEGRVIPSAEPGLGVRRSVPIEPTANGGVE
jgi:muconate cycloisomerase